MKTMFKACGLDIEKVQVVRETDACVYLPRPSGEQRALKKTTYEGYFDTWQEAKTYLVEGITKDLDIAERRFEYQKKKLERVLAMQNTE